MTHVSSLFSTFILFWTIKTWVIHTTEEKLNKMKKNFHEKRIVQYKMRISFQEIKKHWHVDNLCLQNLYVHSWLSGNKENTTKILYLFSLLQSYPSKKRPFLKYFKIALIVWRIKIQNTSNMQKPGILFYFKRCLSTDSFKFLSPC